MRTVRVIATGGTVEKVYDEISEKFIFVDSLGVEETIKECLRQDFLFSRVMRKDSLDMGAVDRTRILEALDEVQESSVLVVHGTSTMTDTAEFILDAEASSSEKTIVFTGSLYPAELRKPETFFNLGLGFSAALLLPPGVYIAMHGSVLPAGKILKDRSSGTFLPEGEM
ncbi:MAG: asparaginase domain-containing protein [Jannaschia sp.]